MKNPEKLIEKVKYTRWLNLSIVFDWCVGIVILLSVLLCIILPTRFFVKASIEKKNSELYSLQYRLDLARGNEMYWKGLYYAALTRLTPPTQCCCDFSTPTPTPSLTPSSSPTPPDIKLTSRIELTSSHQVQIYYIWCARMLGREH